MRSNNLCIDFKFIKIDYDLDNYKYLRYFSDIQILKLIISIFKSQFLRFFNIEYLIVISIKSIKNMIMSQNC